MNIATSFPINTARVVDVLGYASGLGASNPDCARGPSILLPLLEARLGGRGVATRISVHRPVGVGDPTAVTADLCSRLANDVAASATGSHFSVIGGDHSMAIGTWSGAGRAVPGPLGLIWIDAHLDAHTPATTPSGRLHGMPVAALLGHGDRRLTALAGPRTAAIAPEHLTIIGVRSYEVAEAALLARLGVRVITMEDVRYDSFAVALAVALQRARRGTAGFGISIDLDAFDPEDAPGVSAPVSGGLRRDQVLPALHDLAEYPDLRGVEVAEFSPQHDRSGRTARLAVDLIATTLFGRSK